MTIQEALEYMDSRVQPYRYQVKRVNGGAKLNWNGSDRTHMVALEICDLMANDWECTLL